MKLKRLQYRKYFINQNNSLLSNVMYSTTGRRIKSKKVWQGQQTGDYGGEFTGLK
jgi:hypothetical protein